MTGPSQTQNPSMTPDRSQKSHAPRRPEVYIGFGTALEIMRHVGIRRVTPIARKHLVSPVAPTKSELDDAFGRFRRTCGNVALSYPQHILVGSETRFKPSQEYKPHMCSEELPRQSLYRLGESLLIATPELAFAQMATSLTLIELIELGYEICGTYWRDRNGGPCRYQLEPLTNARRLLDYAQRNTHVPGTSKARRAAKYVLDSSASPRESKLAMLLLMPTRYGGYGLSGFCMNQKVDATSKTQVTAHRAFFKCDVCWPAEKIDLEYQSREIHESVSSRISDSKRANALKSMGWHVVDITNEELDSFTSTDVIVGSILKRLGKRPRTSVKGYRQKQLELRRQIGLPYEGSARYVPMWEEFG